LEREAARLAAKIAAAREARKVRMNRG